jgi:hypothetical protein
LRYDGGVGRFFGNWPPAASIADLHVLCGGVDVAAEIELQRDLCVVPSTLVEVIC